MPVDDSILIVPSSAHGRRTKLNLSIHSIVRRKVSYVPGPGIEIPYNYYLPLAHCCDEAFL